MTFPPPLEMEASGLLLLMEMLFSTRLAELPVPRTMPYACPPGFSSRESCTYESRTSHR